MPMNFHTVIESRRKQKRYTIAELAIEAGVDRSRLHKWLTGKRDKNGKKVGAPNGRTIEKLLDALGCEAFKFRKT